MSLKRRNWTNAIFEGITLTDATPDVLSVPILFILKSVSKSNATHPYCHLNDHLSKHSKGQSQSIVVRTFSSVSNSSTYFWISYLQFFLWTDDRHTISYHASQTTLCLLFWIQCSPYMGIIFVHSARSYHIGRASPFGTTKYKGLRFAEMHQYQQVWKNAVLLSEIMLTYC